MLRKSVVSVIALFAGMSATVAQAVEVKPCLTKMETENLFTALMPDIIDGIGKKCSATLPASAMLRNGLSPLVARYRPTADAAWPKATGTLAKLSGMDAKGMDLTVMRPMISPMVASLISEKLQLNDCATADRAVTLLAPLPPENLSGLVVLVAQLGMKDEKNPPFTICPDAPVTPAHSATLPIRS